MGDFWFWTKQLAVEGVKFVVGSFIVFCIFALFILFLENGGLAGLFGF